MNNENENQSMTPEGEVATPDINTSPTNKRNNLIAVIMGGLLILLMLVCVWLFWQNNQLKKEISLLNEVQQESIPNANEEVSTPTLAITEKPTMEPTVEPVVIPDDWVVNEGTDSQMGLTVSIAVPGEFTFGFTGSEWSLMNYETQDYWDYMSSIMFDADGNPVNKYDGGSRRAWYKSYLDGDLGNNIPPVKLGEILSVTEHSAGDRTYLAVVVEMLGNEGSETHFLYVENNIVHIIRPYSDMARSGDSPIEENMGAILSSLNSEWVQ